MAAVQLSLPLDVPSAAGSTRSRSGRLRGTNRAADTRLRRSPRKPVAARTSPHKRNSVSRQPAGQVPQLNLANLPDFGAPQPDPRLTQSARGSGQPFVLDSSAGLSQTSRSPPRVQARSLRGRVRKPKRYLSHHNPFSSSNSQSSRRRENTTRVRGLSDALLVGSSGKMSNRGNPTKPVKEAPEPQSMQARTSTVSVPTSQRVVVTTGALQQIRNSAFGAAGLMMDTEPRSPSSPKSTGPPSTLTAPTSPSRAPADSVARGGGVSVNSFRASLLVPNAAPPPRKETRATPRPRTLSPRAQLSPTSGAVAQSLRASVLVPAAATNRKGLKGSAKASNTASATGDQPVSTLPNLQDLATADVPKTTLSAWLHSAIERGSLAEATVLLRRSDAAEFVNMPDEAGHTPMHCAAQQGNLGLASLIIHHWGSVDIRTSSSSAQRGRRTHGRRRGLTPLALAVLNNKYRMAKFLLECGADPAQVKVDELRAALPQHVRNSAGFTSGPISSKMQELLASFPPLTQEQRRKMALFISMGSATMSGVVRRRAQTGEITRVPLDELLQHGNGELPQMRVSQFSGLPVRSSVAATPHGDIASALTLTPQPPAKAKPHTIMLGSADVSLPPTQAHPGVRPRTGPQPSTKSTARGKGSGPHVLTFGATSALLFSTTAAAGPASSTASAMSSAAASSGTSTVATSSANASAVGSTTAPSSTAGRRVNVTPSPCSKTPQPGQGGLGVGLGVNGSKGRPLTQGATSSSSARGRLMALSVPEAPISPGGKLPISPTSSRARVFDMSSMDYGFQHEAQTPRRHRGRLRSARAHPLATEPKRDSVKSTEEITHWSKVDPMFWSVEQVRAWLCEHPLLNVIEFADNFVHHNVDGVHLLSLPAAERLVLRVLREDSATPQKTHHHRNSTSSVLSLRALPDTSFITTLETLGVHDMATKHTILEAIKSLEDTVADQAALARLHQASRNPKWWKDNRVHPSDPDFDLAVYGGNSRPSGSVTSVASMHRPFHARSSITGISGSGANSNPSGVRTSIVFAGADALLPHVGTSSGFMNRGSVTGSPRRSLAFKTSPRRSLAHGNEHPRMSLASSIGRMSLMGSKRISTIEPSLGLSDFDTDNNPMADSAALVSAATLSAVPHRTAASLYEKAYERPKPLRYVRKFKPKKFRRRRKPVQPKEAEPKSERPRVKRPPIPSVPPAPRRSRIKKKEPPPPPPRPVSPGWVPEVVPAPWDAAMHLSQHERARLSWLFDDIDQHSRRELHLQDIAAFNSLLDPELTDEMALRDAHEFLVYVDLSDSRRVTHAEWMLAWKRVARRDGKAAIHQFLEDYARALERQIRLAPASKRRASMAMFHTYQALHGSKPDLSGAPSTSVAVTGPGDALGGKLAPDVHAVAPKPLHHMFHLRRPSLKAIRQLQEEMEEQAMPTVPLDRAHLKQQTSHHKRTMHLQKHKQGMHDRLMKRHDNGVWAPASTEAVAPLSSTAEVLADAQNHTVHHQHHHAALSTDASLQNGLGAMDVTLQGAGHQYLGNPTAHKPGRPGHTRAHTHMGFGLHRVDSLARMDTTSRASDLFARAPAVVPEEDTTHSSSGRVHIDLSPESTQRTLGHGGHQEIHHNSEEILEELLHKASKHAADHAHGTHRPSGHARGKLHRGISKRIVPVNS